ncbi:hypothetical protein BC835DRAFT_1425164 [Cytidiella melzeri]|nr:hypothetical protein BC835DRAFT_1425164 [Cytidiella melzeri]
MVMIYLIPPSTRALFPAFAQVRETGFYPDGLPVRRTYTGVYILDEVFTGLAGLFSAASDGRDPATHMFCLWFLPQLCAVLVFIYWEAGRVAGTSFSFARLPTFFGILAQLIAAGPTLPLYFIAHIRSIPLVPMTFPSDAAARAWTLFPAIFLGYIVPSAALFLVPSGSTSLNTKQIMAAIWQPFPLYIAVLHPALQYVSKRLSTREVSKKDSCETALYWIKRSYALCGLLSAVAHWTIFLPSISSLFPSFVPRCDDPSISFTNIFVPYPLHSYVLPINSEATTPPTPEYRLAARLLFQHDWLFMTIAAFVFFAWNHLALSRSHTQGAGPNVRERGPDGWLRSLTMFMMIGGPGAAFAWAAIEREDAMHAVIQEKRVAKLLAGGKIGSEVN